MRILSGLIGASALCFLSACGGEDSAAPQSTPSQTSTPTQQVKAEKPELSLEDRGRIVFKKCQACHTLEAGAPNRVGPNLHGVIGRAAASVDGFAYSKAMQASELVWDDATLDAYLKRPAAVVPKGSMVFIGLRKQEDRDAVIAYIKQETGAASQ